MHADSEGPLLGPDHYIALLGIELAPAGGPLTQGRAPVRGQLFAPGTRRVRTGPLTAMVDLVAGHTPDGPFGPTVDLSLDVFAPPPRTGFIALRATPLRVGSNLVVAETILCEEDSGVPFGRAITTFLNNKVGPGWPRGPRIVPPMREASFDELLAPRVVDERTLEVTPSERIDNGIQNTVQGGAQALLAELAAEHACGQGRRMAATALDIRFLSRLRVGPLRATVEPVSEGAPGKVSVQLTDAGQGGKLVSYVALTMTLAVEGD